MRPLHPIGATLLLALLLTPTAATAQDEPRPVRLLRLEPDDLEARIEATGWTVVSAPIQTREDGVTSWIWAVTRGTSGGAVGLYHYDAVQQAQQLVELLGQKDDTAVTRDERVVVSVITTERPADAKILMRDLLADKPRTTTPPPPPPGPAVTASSNLAYFSTTSAEPLPPLRFGELTRAEVVHAVLQHGWTLAAPPETSSGDGYRAVAYTLQAPRGDATGLLTLYGCLTASCAREVALAARVHRGVVLKRGLHVVVVVVPGDPRRARALAGAVGKARR